MGGTGGARLRVPYAALSPPPSPSPVKGEGIEEGESLPEIALVHGLLRASVDAEFPTFPHQLDTLHILQHRDVL